MISSLVLAASLFVECESFRDLGGWKLDAQFMDQMGSPFLLAHGLGSPVADAETSVVLPAGSYKLWVRTRDWVAPQGPGRFEVLANGVKLGEFGKGGDGSWSWWKGGAFASKGGAVELRLHDLTGFEGRCDAIFLAAAGERHGWKDRWIQHVADEPDVVNAAEYRQTCAIARRYMPGVKMMDAVENCAVAGALDMLCPKVDMWQKDRAAFDFQRTNCHDSVWCYTCCVPGGRWLNRTLDCHLLKPLYVFWCCSEFGLDGFLHWGYNMYQKNHDPFNNTTVDNWGTNGGSALPPGDTHVVYPGAVGPWSGARFEATRQGAEDYELLAVLKRRDPAKAAELTPDRRYSHYRAIALALEAYGGAENAACLAKLLKLPGVAGHAFDLKRDGAAPMPRYNDMPSGARVKRSGVPDQERSDCLRELCLARALFNLGDTSDGLGRRLVRIASDGGHVEHRAPDQHQYADRQRDPIIMRGQSAAVALA